ncbi:MAG: DUF1614 domain-containing protein, partial [Gaiellales bacterium]
MDRRAQFFPLEWPFLAALFAALLVVVALVQIGILQYVYERLGIAPGTVFAILAFELLGSYVNLPLAWLRSSPAVEARRIVVYGVPYVVPAVVRPRATLLAVNVGGAVIPTVLSTYLIVHAGVGSSALAATVVVTA